MFKANFNVIVHGFGQNGAYRIEVERTSGHNFLAGQIECGKFVLVCFCLVLVKHNLIVMIVEAGETNRFAALSAPKKWHYSKCVLILNIYNQ